MNAHDRSTAEPGEAPAPAASAPPARPLRELVPLIREDLQQGREAAERAALPYYRAAGDKLLEAKSQLPHGEFTAWIASNFSIKPRTARYYMDLAEKTAGQNGNALPFSSLSDFIRKTSSPTHNRRPPYQEPWWVREAQRREERTHLRSLLLRLIDAGYRALAIKLHPDKGGSHEEMAQLTRGRDELRRAVKRI